jgi:hypothetical protein
MTDPDVKLFFDDAINLAVGQKRHVTKRGDGIVESILTSDWRFIMTPEEPVHISNILRICLHFNDSGLGFRLLPPDGRSGLRVQGWGTYLPGGRGKATTWRVYDP